MHFPRPTSQNLLRADFGLNLGSAIQWLEIVARSRKEPRESGSQDDFAAGLIARDIDVCERSLGRLREHYESLIRLDWLSE